MIKKISKNSKFTRYKVGDEIYDLTRMNRILLVSLLELSPLYFSLRRIEKQSVRRLIESRLVLLKGHVTVECAIRAADEKFITLTKTGCVIAEYVRDEGI